jgi:hypothetical protein
VDDASQERIARNEALFREVNERIRDVAGRFGADEYEFVCECANPDCVARIPVELVEYERIRADGRRFLVVRSHEVPAVERVVAEGDRFVVVEKIDEAAEIADDLDPRSD